VSFVIENIFRRGNLNPKSVVSRIRALPSSQDPARNRRWANTAPTLYPPIPRLDRHSLPRGSVRERMADALNAMLVQLRARPDRRWVSERGPAPFPWVSGLERESVPNEWVSGPVAPWDVRDEWVSGPARGTFGTTPPRLSGYLDDAFCTMQGLDLEADMDLDTTGLISRNLNQICLVYSE